jgi:hypothetical protein
MYALSFLDVKTLLQKEIVNEAWRKLCKETIDVKCGEDGPKAFSIQPRTETRRRYIIQVRNSIHGRD